MSFISLPMAKLVLTGQTVTKPYIITFFKNWIQKISDVICAKMVPCYKGKVESNDWGEGFPTALEKFDFTFLIKIKPVTQNESMQEVTTEQPD